MKNVRIVVHLILFLCLLELSSRYYLFGPHLFNYRMVNSVNALQYTAFVRPSAVPGVRYELKPHLRALYQMRRFDTNADGLREDRDYSRPKPPGVFRIVVMGASNAMGHGVDRTAMFDKLLEGRLNAYQGLPRYESINFSLERYTAQECLSLLTYKAMAYQPDLVLFCMPTRGEERLSRPGGRSDGGERSHAYDFFSCYFWVLVRNTRLFQSEPPVPTVGYSDQSLRTFDTVYRQLAALSASKGIPVCVTVLKYAQGDPSDKGVAQLRDLARAHHLYFVDTWPFIDTRVPLSRYLVFRIDPHPNERAQRVFADAVFASLHAQRVFADTATAGEGDPGAGL